MGGRPDCRALGLTSQTKLVLRFRNSLNSPSTILRLSRFRDARQAKVMVARWHHFHDHQCPHIALGYQDPAQAWQALIKARNIEAGLTA